MSIFQKSVVNKFLNNIDSNSIEKEKVDIAYQNFQKFYGNKTRLDNIMQLKEENYQEGFLREIFVQTLGYTINPDENFNLTTEYKNQKDSRKADGAIIKDGKAVGVIELKSTKTKNLDSIKEQAFGYKNNQSNCKYVITSNFHNLRFYIENATEYEEFDLFKLGESEKYSEEFKKFYLLLSNESILSDLPEKIKQETKFHENEITKHLYSDYKQFKNKIFQNLVQNNQQYDKLILFKKSQKLLDRFLFVFFAEDCGLIPPNTISKIIDQWKVFIEEDEYFTLYSRFQKLFSHINKGHNYKKWGEIPAYNGGLFRYDDILDNKETIIDDVVLEKDSLKLSAYDFNTEVDVNILGHIFEHSLNEIEEVSAEIEGEKSIAKKVSKRKKDGVFYTPKYITKYIVENTVGKLCDEKKQEMGIDSLLIDDKYRKKDGKINEKGRGLFDTLNSYKDWLFSLKILDPACGSGAFLNQTLDYLIGVHKEIDDLITELEGKSDALRLYDTDKSVLENNIYGVDINEESIEIAKLSLWLRTAQKGRKLSDLSNNIKCGNSLIDDPEVAGEKAFKWEEEYKEIFDNGGFDVVIGNPPYGATISKIEKEYYYKKYKTAHYKLDSFSLFIERAIDIIKKNKVLGLIVPYTLLTIQQHTKLRKYILDFNFQQIINLPTKIFTDADLDTVIAIIRKDNFGNEIKTGKIYCNEIKFCNVLSYKNINLSTDLLINVNLTFSDYQILNKLKKLEKLTKYFEVSQGYIPYRRSDLIIAYGKEEGNKIVNERLWHSSKKIGADFKQEIQGKDLSRYSYNESFQYVKYGKHLAGYVDPKYFNSPRILIMEVTRGQRYVLKSCFVDNEYYNTPSIINIISKNSDNECLKYLLSTMNSSLFSWYHKKVHPKANAITSIPKILVNDIRNLPFKEISPEAQQPFIEKADTMLKLNKDLQTEKDNFINTLKEEKGVEKITKKLNSFNTLEFDTFKKELYKQKIKFALGEENNSWRDYFNSTRDKANELQAEIDRTDKEIDAMVYELYGLSDEEILVVEGRG